MQQVTIRIDMPLDQPGQGEKAQAAGEGRCYQAVKHAPKSEKCAQLSELILYCSQANEFEQQCIVAQTSDRVGETQEP
jgi:hypothetical protein